MMMNTTLDQLRGLKLVSMAQALQEQMQQSGISAMSFEERLAWWTGRSKAGKTGAAPSCSKPPDSIPASDDRGLGLPGLAGD
jgi:hypothetical protein